jgi:hypothetical protein
MREMTAAVELEWQNEMHAAK